MNSDSSEALTEQQKAMIAHSLEYHKRLNELIKSDPRSPFEDLADYRRQTTECTVTRDDDER